MIELKDFYKDEVIFWSKYDTQKTKEYEEKKKMYKNKLKELKALAPEKVVPKEDRIMKLLSHEKEDLLKLVKKGEKTRKLHRKVRCLKKIQKIFNFVLEDKE